MRSLTLAFLAVCASVLAQTDHGTITFTNKSGDVISNAVVTKVEAGNLTYRYSVGVGGGVVALADLAEGSRARFGYSPDRADNAAALERHLEQTKADRRKSEETKKFEETKMRAEKGAAQAQVDLGFCYFRGDGVTPDWAEAVKWYRKAAEQGCATAQSILGVCYEKGTGVPGDAIEAVKWYRKAAEQGDASGETSLGRCYSNGDGVIKDAVEAAKWYRKAAEQGVAEAQRALGLCYHLGEGVAKNAVEAAKWWRRAAEQGLARAQFDLGLC